MPLSSKLFVAMLFGFLLFPVAAQDIPDIVGKPLPQAAAELNAAGFLLGDITFAESQDSTNLNTIGAATLRDDRTVDVTVVQVFNIRLLYTGNALHLISLSDDILGLKQLIFSSDSGSFSAEEWGDWLRSRQCVQAWIDFRDAPTRPEDCLTVQGDGFLHSLAASKQFWLNTDSFSVYQDGLLRGTCSVAAGECELWISTNDIDPESPGRADLHFKQLTSEDVTEYVYFVYDSHNLYVYNRSDTRWMPLATIAIVDARVLTDDRFFDKANLRGDVNFLAPGQCWHITDGTPLPENNAPLITCDVLAQATYQSRDRFWLNGFTLTGVLDIEAQRQCPAVTDDERTVCLLPR